MTLCSNSKERFQSSRHEIIDFLKSIETPSKQFTRLREIDNYCDSLASKSLSLRNNNVEVIIAADILATKLFLKPMFEVGFVLDDSGNGDVSFTRVNADWTKSILSEMVQISEDLGFTTLFHLNPCSDDYAMEYEVFSELTLPRFTEKLDLQKLRNFPLLKCKESWSSQQAEMIYLYLTSKCTYIIG